MGNDDQIKKTPLNKWHRAHGAKMVDFGGWDMPVQYDAGILKEHLATRKFAGLFDISHMGRFRIKGRDRIPFLQHVLSNNCESLEPWEAQYTLVPNECGGLIDDAYLYRFGEDDYILVVNASNRAACWNHFQEQAERFKDLTLEDHTEKIAMIAFQGPLSKEILEGVIENGDLPRPMRNCLSEIELCGTRVLVSRTGYTGEPIGLELFVPTEKAEEIWSKLIEQGRTRGVMPIGLGARDTLRLEAGMPLYGHEFGIDPEGREFPAFGFPLTRVAVSFSERKGDFVGRDALMKQFEQIQKLLTGNYERSAILPRRIMLVAVLDKGVVRAGDEVFLNDRKVGVVTSGTSVPYWRFEGEGATMAITNETFLRSIAFAYVDAEFLPDQKLEVAVRKNRLSVQTVRWHARSEAPPYLRPIPVGYEKPEPDLAAGTGAERAGVVIKKSLENHEWRRQRCVNMIPSEMTPSGLVRLLQISDPVGRYAEHKSLMAAFEQEVFYYQGTDFIAWVEERLAVEMADYLGCPLVEARAISGQMANMTVFSGLVDYRNRTNRRQEAKRISLAMNNYIGNGGHLSAQPMGALRDYIAKDPVTEQYAVINFPVCKDNPYRLDVEETGKILDKVNPEIIIFGKSMVLHPEPVAEIVGMLGTDENKPVIMYDMAHVLGLIGPHFQEPFKDGADIVTGSTHKTFFGTQRGIIGVNYQENTPQFELWEAIQRRAFPGMVSNHHLGTILGLLLAAIEMNTFKSEYQPQVISNAKTFARALKDVGLNVAGDAAVSYTETHQVIVDVGYATGCNIARNLEDNNIVVNYQAVPSDEGFSASSGLRLGVSEMTRFGMKEKDFEEFALLFADAVKGCKGVGDKVAEFRSRFQKINYSFDDTMLEPFKKQFLAML